MTTEQGAHTFVDCNERYCADHLQEWCDLFDLQRFEATKHEDDDVTDGDDDTHTARRQRVSYVVAAYEVDRAYGGPEEGGWWFNTGVLMRTVAVTPNEDTAIKLCRRRNNLMHHLQRNHRDIYSVAYAGGRYAYYIFENTAPQCFPEHRPHYE